MKKIHMLVIACVLVALGFYGGFAYKQKKDSGVYSSAYTAGHDAGYNAGYDEGAADQKTFSVSYAKYNKLVDAYNKLRNQVPKYVTPTYTAPTHISCSGSSIGSYTYTNCY